MSRTRNGEKRDELRTIETLNDLLLRAYGNMDAARYYKRSGTTPEIVQDCVEGARKYMKRYRVAVNDPAALRKPFV